MRRFETPYIADWFATSLRWMVLVGLIISLSLRVETVASHVWSFGLLFVWNVIMSLLAGLSIRISRFHRQIVLSVDFLLAAIFFWLQGGLDGASAWVGLFPILTSAVYFEMWGAFITAVLFAILQYVVSFDSFSNNLSLMVYSGLALTLLIGLASGLSGRFLMRRLRTERHHRLDEEERRRRMES
ncbi:MAG TPA: hypothetical protein VN843_08845, partial [Anaerolineales bacterium]|nr:hypothetical protein [Anaerolineales bacterium]